jgi:hypothetical protein
MMVIDMTAQLAPLLGVLLALVLVPAARIALAIVLEPRIVWRGDGAVAVRRRVRKDVRLRDVSLSRA